MAGCGWWLAGLVLVGILLCRQGSGLGTGWARRCPPSLARRSASAPVAADSMDGSRLGPSAAGVAPRGGCRPPRRTRPRGARPAAKKKKIVRSSGFDSGCVNKSGQGKKNARVRVPFPGGARRLPARSAVYSISPLSGYGLGFAVVRAFRGGASGARDGERGANGSAGSGFGRARRARARLLICLRARARGVARTARGGPRRHTARLSPPPDSRHGRPLDVRRCVRARGALDAKGRREISLARVCGAGVGRERERRASRLPRARARAHPRAPFGPRGNFPQVISLWVMRRKGMREDVRNLRLCARPERRAVPLRLCGRERFHPYPLAAVGRRRARRPRPPAGDPSLIAQHRTH